MTTTRRRLMLVIGAVLLVGGWATHRYGLDEYIADKTWLNEADTEFAVGIGMMIGAALILGGVMMTTIWRRKDE